MRVSLIAGLAALLLSVDLAIAADAPLDRAARLDEEALRLYWAARYADGVPKARASLSLREKALGRTHPDVANSLEILGGLQHMLAKYADARSAHERALRIREQALGPAHPRVASSLSHLATLFEAMGDYPEALSLLERAVAIQERTLEPQHRDLAASLTSLGLVLRMTGQYAAARTHLERALRIREQGPIQMDLANTVFNLGSLAYGTGDYAAARALHMRALTIREHAVGAKHPDVAASLGSLALIHLATRNYAEARPLQERAAKIYEETLGPQHPYVASSLRILGLLLHGSGDLAAARQVYERALRLREQGLGPRHPGIAMVMYNLAEVHRAAGAHAAARTLYERALASARRQAVPELLWPVFVRLAAIREADGRLDEAVALYREGVDLLTRASAQFADEAARTRFLEADDKLSAYDALARLLLKLHHRHPGRGHDRDALAVIEAKKGRIIAEALASAPPIIQDATARAQLAQAQARRHHLSSLEKSLAAEQAKMPAQQSVERVRTLTTSLAKTKGEYLALVRPLLARYRSLFPDQEVIDPTTPAKFAAWLPPQTLAVSFFPSRDELYLFIVASGGVFRVKSRAVSQVDLFDLVRRYRELVAEAQHQRLSWDDDGSESYRRYVAPLHVVSLQLAEHLLGPLEDELRQSPNIILMPNDLLLHLPIHALPRRDGDARPRFLAETHVVSYLTRMEQAYLRPAAEARAELPLIALGNPDGSLRMASREVEALKGLRRTATLLDGAQATKAALLALIDQSGGANDLHFATHGVLDQRRPERSYLLMAGADERSQRLEIGEIRGLTLQTRLAVLSACDTAVGEEVPGAALVTLAAAFSEAGAESVVASLWKVEDEAAKDVMVAFHRALARQGRVAALQQAQGSVMREPRTRHPFYWAPFILIGGR